MPNSHYEKFTLTGEVKCIDDEIPFDLPKGWEWVRLGSISKFSIGKTPERGNSRYWENGIYSWVSISDMKPNEYIHSTKEKVSQDAVSKCFGDISPKGSLLMSFKLTIGRTSILMMEAYHNEAIVTLIPFIDLDYALRNYLFYVLPVTSNMSEPNDAIKGKTQNSKSLFNILLPLPPLAEQQRIVAKIEELMPLVEQYGKAQSELEALNSNIREQLKKSVLQYAIEGKLVPQCEEDGTAEDLLAEIQAEKQRLYAEGKLKKKDLAHSIIFRGEDSKYYEQIGKTCVCIDDEIPFEIPSSWRWVRMGDITNMYTGNSINKETKETLYTNVEGIPYIATKDVGFDNNIGYNNGIAIPDSAISSFRIAPAGSVLVCIEGGSAGRKVGLLQQNVCFGNKLCCLQSYANSSHYIFQYLQSFTFFELFAGYKNGIIGGVSLNGLKGILLPLPPLKEQERISKALTEFLTLVS